MYVTYSDLIQIGIFIVARIVLHDLWEKKIAAHYCNSERLVLKSI